MAAGFRRIVSLFLMLSTVMCVLAFTPAQAHAFSRYTWLVVDKLNLTLPTSPGHDSFVLQGSFNMPLGVVESTDVSLTIDSSTTLLFPKSEWKRQGTSNIISTHGGGKTGRINFWIGGSTKCTFKFTGVKQTLRGNMPNYPNLPVRLVVGPQFDEALTVVMKTRGRAAKLDTIDNRPKIFIKKLQVTLNRKTIGKDSILFEEQLYSDWTVDPSNDDITVAIGTYSQSIPKGSMTETAGSNKIKYRGTTAGGGTVTLSIDKVTGKIVFMANKLDLSPSAWTPGDVGITIIGTEHILIQEDVIIMQANKAGTIYKY